MKRNPTKTTLVIAFILLTSAVYADVTLPALFQDHMVLQRQKQVTIWGWADPGEKVEVKGSWQWLWGASTKTDENGNWKVKIQTPNAGKPQTLTIKGNNEIVLKDILMGEVWICSGQSNMEYHMNWLRSERIEQDITKADYPNIRLFTVQKKIAIAPEKDVTGTWQLCTPDTVKDFSATAYYFGQNLHEKLNVPIGLISTNWGGTVSEAWTTAEGLAPFDQFTDTLKLFENPETAEETAQEKYKEDIKQWEAEIAAVDTGTQEGWQNPEFDDSDWKETQMPSPWTGTELESIDGIVWYRRVTSLPPSWSRNDMELHLGPIDDMDTLWVNGYLIGTTTRWDKQRVYILPKEVLRTGKNIIAVRVVDYQGEGGFCGKEDDMRIGPPGADIKTCATVAKTWKYKFSYTGKLPQVPTDASFASNPNTPTVLYNGMIAPLIPFRIAGAIWYQGESNCYDPILYRTLFPAMIKDWRKQWKQGNFPFYFVQIAPYEYGPTTCSQAIREAQLMSLSTPNTGMAVIMDIGEEKDIHPKNKHDVGDRLARWALAKTYKKKNIVYSGPLYKDMKVERESIRIFFDYTDSGLVSKGGPLTDFFIAGEDRKFVPAKAIIEGDTVVVSSQDIKKPVAVRYAWSNWAAPNLFNEAGLPASSFRTDDWPLFE